MTGQDIFNQTMLLMGKVKSDGTLDSSKTARYITRSISLLTAWQNEIQTMLGETLSTELTSLANTITVNDKISGAYFLAANFLLAEADLDRASFYQQKYEENKKLLLNRQRASEVDITDSYGLKLPKDGR